MNKFSKLFTGFAAVALLASCSSDDPVPGNPDDNQKPAGELAYMAVTISSAESSRATEDGGYVPSWDGPADEHAVSNVRFFFYDEDGTFVLEAKDPTPAVTNNGTSPAKPNVEYIGSKNIVVLEGLKGKGYPKYMVTVLNAADFTLPGNKTLKETSEALTEFAHGLTDGIENAKAPKEFVMTTSSFFGETHRNHKNEVATLADPTKKIATYYATVLDPSDFKLTRDDAADTSDPVQVYVERLAAKVQVDIDQTNADKVFTDPVTKKTYFKINTSLAGGNNTTNTGATAGTTPSTSGSAVADVELYIEVTNWGLNALAPKSYMSKQLDLAWNTTPIFDKWNNETDWRSFWGMSTIYGEDFKGDNPLHFVKPYEIFGEDATTHKPYGRLIGSTDSKEYNVSIR